MLINKRNNKKEEIRMDEIKKEKAIVGTIFAMILMIIFNDKLNELVGEAASFEVKILLRAGMLGVFILMATIFPIGLAKTDKIGER